MITMISKEELIKLGISEEIADKITARVDEILTEYVPRGKYDEACEASKKLEEELSKQDDRADALAAEIESLGAAHQKEMRIVKTEAAIMAALSAARAKNNKAARALLEIDTENALDENGCITGLDEQIQRLKTDKSTAFLFESGVVKLKGITPGESAAGRADFADGADVTYGDTMKYSEIVAHGEIFGS